MIDCETAFICASAGVVLGLLFRQLDSLWSSCKRLYVQGELWK
jgi:hypothetical protein